MAVNPLTRNALCKAEMEYHGSFGHTRVWINHIALMSIIYICCAAYRLETQTVSSTLTFSKVSSTVFNICMVTLIYPSFILIFFMMDKISSYLHEFGIKFKTIQPKFSQNYIKMRIMI